MNKLLKTTKPMAAKRPFLGLAFFKNSGRRPTHASHHTKPSGSIFLPIVEQINRASER